MKNFTEYFPLKNFKTLVDHSNHGGKIDNKWRDEHQKLVEKLLLAPVYKFLMDYKEEFTLPPVSNGAGHRTNFQAFWESLIEQDTHEAYKINHHLDLMLYKSLSMASYFIGKEPEKLVELYEKFSKQINDGNLGHYELSSDHYCFGCGDNYSMTVKNWQPTFLKFDPDASDKYSVAEPCTNEPMHHLNIEFKTGNLILSDWIKIEPFTQIVDQDQNYDVNCEKERAALTQMYAEKFNFLSVNSSGSAYIFNDNGKLVFGQYDEESEDLPSSYVDAGRVPSGYRAVTIIEETQLHAILAAQHGDDSAAKMISTYLQEDDFVRLNIEPGNYHLTFSGSCHEFGARIDESFPLAIKPYFTLEKTELVKKPKMN